MCARAYARVRVRTCAQAERVLRTVVSAGGVHALAAMLPASVDRTSHFTPVRRAAPRRSALRVDATCVRCNRCKPVTAAASVATRRKGGPLRLVLTGT